MRMGCAESLAIPKIATIEKMRARVQLKTEPRIAPPTAMLILKEKCASIVLTTWPFMRLKSKAKKMPNAATMRRNAMGGTCCCGRPGKRKLEGARVPGDRHYGRCDPRAKPAFKVRKKETSPSQFLAHCASKDL
jgi:hypothetical protein